MPPPFFNNRVGSRVNHQPNKLLEGIRRFAEKKVEALVNWVFLSSEMEKSPETIAAIEALKKAREANPESPLRVKTDGTIEVGGQGGNEQGSNEKRK